MESLFELVPAKEYGQRLLKEIPLAKQRIVIAVMVMYWDEAMADYFNLLLQAQQRGVQVHLLYDRYSWLPFAFNKTLPSRRIAKQVAELKEFTIRLKAAGGKVTLVGKTWSHNPFAHRQHAKVTLIDDIVYSFGGVNFSSNHFDYFDLMCRKQDAALAARLEALVAQMAVDYPVNNQRIDISDTSSILFDGGRPRQSIIYDTALRLAEEARKIYFVSQYSPSGKLAKAMKGKADCYFNHWHNTSGVGRFTNEVDRHRYHIANLYAKPTYIHAKFMLFEMKDGSKKLLTGSSNFSWRGVSYGTKEICLESSDEALWRALRRHMARLEPSLNPGL